MQQFCENCTNHFVKLLYVVIPEGTEPANPEEVLLECFVVAKNTLGDEYYPSVTINEEDIPEMFGVNPDDYVFAKGQKSADDARFDLLVCFKTENEDSRERLRGDLLEYVNNLIDNADQYPEHIGIAFDSLLITRDNWGYVFLIATFGDIDKLDVNNPDEIKNYSVTNTLKVSDAIIARIHP